MYASFLAARGHEVTVYVKSSRSIRRTIANVLQIGKPTWVPGIAQVEVRRIPSFHEQYLADADVLVTTTCQNTIETEHVSNRKGKKCYLLQHDEGLYHGPRDVADRAYRSDTTKIVVATWLKDLLRERYQQDSKLLINPIDLKQFEQRERTASLDEIRILVLNHEYEWKGTKEAVELVQRMKELHPNVRLIMYGARSSSPQYEGVDEYYFNVPQYELATIYSNCDIYLCASWDEGFGLPSIEAMACGAMLVTYDNGGSRDFAIDGKTALVAPRKNKEKLGELLERAVTTTEERKRIAGEGKNYVTKMPGWETRVTELEEIFLSIIAHEQTI